jgi:hypothetical protein
MQAIGTIKGVVAAWISNYYLRQNNCVILVQLSPTQVH